MLGHSAGGHKADRAMQALAARLGALRLDVVRFDFPYRTHGRRLPDPMPVLQAACTEAIHQVIHEYSPRRLILGGRSMGGRVATMLAAQGFACDGLLLFAYPLHPDGKPEKLRDAHLPSIRVPVLCINGTRDRLCRRDLMEAALAKVSAPWRMHWIEGVGHSFHDFPETEIGEWISSLEC